jgi:hypothetical protein
LLSPWGRKRKSFCLSEQRTAGLSQRATHRRCHHAPNLSRGGGLAGRVAAADVGKQSLRTCCFADQLVQRNSARMPGVFTPSQLLESWEALRAVSRLRRGTYGTLPIGQLGESPSITHRGRVRSLPVGDARQICFDQSRHPFLRPIPSVLTVEEAVPTYIGTGALGPH